MDADALSRILWEEHDQHTEAESMQAIIANVTQGSAFLEEYSSHIQVTSIMDTQEDLRAMSLKDWTVAQS